MFVENAGSSCQFGGHKSNTQVHGQHTNPEAHDHIQASQGDAEGLPSSVGDCT